eukprot:4855021-Prymnesium_polylepis.1
MDAAKEVHGNARDSTLSAPFQHYCPQCPPGACIRSTCSRAELYMHMQSASSAVSTPTCDRARHTTPRWPLSCTLTVRPTSPAAPGRSSGRCRSGS